MKEVTFNSEREQRRNLHIVRIARIHVLHEIAAGRVRAWAYDEKRG